MKQLLALVLLISLVCLAQKVAGFKVQRAISGLLCKTLNLTIPKSKKGDHRWFFRKLAGSFRPKKSNPLISMMVILKASYLKFKFLGEEKDITFFHFVNKTARRLPKGPLRDFFSNPQKLKGRPGIPIEVCDHGLRSLETQGFNAKTISYMIKEMVELYGDIYFGEPVKEDDMDLPPELIIKFDAALTACMRSRNDKCFERMHEDFPNVDLFLQARLRDAIQRPLNMFLKQLTLAQTIRAKIRYLSFDEEILMYQKADDFKQGKEGATLELCKPGVLRYVTQKDSRQGFKNAFSRLEVTDVMDILSPECLAEWGPLERLALLNYGELYRELPETVQEYLSKNISCEEWELSPWTLLPTSVLQRCMLGKTINDFIGLPFTPVPDHLQPDLYSFLAQHELAWAAIDHLHSAGSSAQVAMQLPVIGSQFQHSADSKVLLLGFVRFLGVLRIFKGRTDESKIVDKLGTILGLSNATFLSPTQLQSFLRVFFDDLSEHQLERLSFDIRLLKLPWMMADQEDFYAEFISQINPFPELLPEPSLLKDWCKQAKNEYSKLETVEYYQHLNDSFNKSKDNKQLIIMLLRLHELVLMNGVNSSDFHKYILDERKLQPGALLDLSKVQEQDPRKLAQRFLLETGKFIKESPALFQASNFRINYGHGFDAGAITRMWLERVEEAIHYPENHLMIKDSSGYAIPDLLVGETGAKQLGSVYGALLTFAVTPSVQLSPRFIDLLPKHKYPDVVDKFFNDHYGFLSKRANKRFNKFLPTRLTLTELGKASNFFDRKSKTKVMDAATYRRDNFSNLLYSFAEGFYSFVNIAAHQSLLEATDREVLYRLLRPQKVSFEEFWKHVQIDHGTIENTSIESLIPGHKLSISDAIKSVWSVLNESELDRLYQLFTGAKRLLGLQPPLSVKFQIAQPDAYLESGAKSCSILKSIRGMEKMVFVKDLKEPRGLNKARVIKKILKDAETRPAEQYTSPRRYIELFRLVAQKQCELLGLKKEEFDLDPFNPAAPNFWDGRNLPVKFQSCSMQLTMTILDDTTAKKLKRSGAMFVSQMINLLNTNAQEFMD